jgi:hypothetical protein
MGFTSDAGQPGRNFARKEMGVVAWVLTSVVALGGNTGCGVAEAPAEEQVPGLETQEQAQEVDNGLSLNGLSLNGLSLNGLSLNGLSLNGLSTQEFSTWFNQDASGHEQLMRYIVLCAVPAGESRTFTNPATGLTHVWEGSLGLAPDWAAGASATEVEQQTVSACLAAHANNYGVHVSISVLGRGADGVEIPVAPGELDGYPVRESCFFGNVFKDEGLFAGNDRNALAEDESTPRPCGLVGYGALTNDRCEQVARVGQCENHCTLDATGGYYTECTLNGVKYRPLTTRLQGLDVHRCGDGVCQVGERCGWSLSADACMDCGACQ